MSDSEFLKAFDECAFTSSTWTHEAHLRMGFLILKAEPYEAALARVRAGLQKLNGVIGTTGRGYHETITVAYLRLLKSRLAKAPWISWRGFEEAYGDLFASSYLDKHYSREALDRPEAKTRFVDPDREPLP